ncbi:MAG: S8 family serine peptidase [Roseibacillus sp.]
MERNQEKLAKARKQKKEAFPKGRHDLKDKKVRAELVRRLKEADEAHMEAVRERAALQGLELAGSRPDGGSFRLIDFDEKGTPIYEDTMNSDAAITTAADQVRDNPIYQNTVQVQVEAESFITMSGVVSETTTDAGGGQNIGYIENGDWVEYTINVPETGQYRINIRTASNNNDGGTINLSIDGSSIGSVEVPDSNGWQTWTTILGYAYFDTTGSKTLRMDFSGGGGSLFNVNWFSYNRTVIIGQWESNTARTTHRELEGKVSVWDGSTPGSDQNHATHVAGTLVSRGINSNTLGMAPEASVASFNTSSSTSEMIANAAVGPNTTDLHLSNHSYGVTRGWRNSGGWQWRGEYSPGGNQADFYDEDFGRYNSRSEDWDEIAYNAPYYLIFISAGNGRGNVPSAGDSWTYVDNFSTVTVPSYDDSIHPLSNRAYKGNNDGFDTMEGGGLGKNTIAVGSSDEGVDGSGNRNPSLATAQSYSCRGPADDGRIKPDIHGNGTGLTSSIASSNTATASYGGTSMSSPNVCGSAALLIDYYGTRFPAQAMRASSLKGLILHTADDRGDPGPDYKYGWGVMNTQFAADVIKLHADGIGGAHLIESIVNDTITSSESHSFDWDGNSPLRVTLCWTDPASDEIDGHDNRTKALVNDLNLRVTGPGGTHYPYVMPYVGDWSLATIDDHATKGVNTVDPIEQVYLASPAAGTYTVTIDYAGSLTHDEQDYSLIVSGTASDAPTIEVTTATYDIASPPSFSTNDLTQTEYLSSSATGGNESAEHAQLFNGTIGNDDGDRSDSGEVQLASGNTVTVNLDTSVHTGGYDLTGIETIFGWNTGANGRSNQGYEVILTYIDNSTATLAGPTHWEPNSPAQFWTKVSFADEEGGVLQSNRINHNGNTSAGTGVIASGVKAITFEISNNANAGSWVIAREFDIFGYPTGGPYTALESWRLTHFGTTEGTGNFADDADFDNDGNVNLLEFATATDPKVSNSDPVTFTSNASAFDLTYDRNIDAMLDYDFEVEWNNDLSNAGTWFGTGVTELLLSDDGSIQEVKATAPKDGEARRFFRLRVSPK